jgi:serine/threonine protein phosphatase PrpC
VHVQPGDAIIFCTDGIWSVIEDEEFGALTAATQDPSQLSNKILDMALARDTDDNVSLITVFLHRLTDQSESRTENGSGIFSRIFGQGSKKKDV